MDIFDRNIKGIYYSNKDLRFIVHALWSHWSYFGSPADIKILDLQRTCGYQFYSHDKNYIERNLVNVFLTDAWEKGLQLIAFDGPTWYACPGGREIQQEFDKSLPCRPPVEGEFGVCRIKGLAVPIIKMDLQASKRGIRHE